MMQICVYVVSKFVYMTCTGRKMHVTALLCTPWGGRNHDAGLLVHVDVCTCIHPYVAEYLLDVCTCIHPYVDEYLVDVCTCIHRVMP